MPVAPVKLMSPPLPDAKLTVAVPVPIGVPGVGIPVVVDPEESATKAPATRVMSVGGVNPNVLGGFVLAVEIDAPIPPVMLPLARIVMSC